MTPSGPSLVVDASVAVKLSLPEALSERAEAVFALLTARPPVLLFVPDLFYIECANVLWKAVRRGDLTDDEASIELATLRQLAIHAVSTRQLMEDALRLAGRYGITAYDAAYVALADRESSTLVSDDRVLIQKLAGTSHRIVWLGDFEWPLAQPRR